MSHEVRDKMGENSLPSFEVDDSPIDLKEAAQIRDDAKRLGAAEFVALYLFEKKYNIRRLLKIFKDQFSEDEWDDISGDIMSRGELPELYACSHIAIQRFIECRTRLQHIHSLDHVEELLRNCSKIMVISGAGISVSCGIPDFRSKDGIYARLTDYELEDPTQMFDLDYFKHKPETFYSFANEIYPSNFKPSPSHAFVAYLEQHEKLLRNYTQNIDTIEELAGITRVIQCHGSFRTARCVTCGHSVPGRAIAADIFAKTVPKCPACPPESEFPVMKPEIVFFGEQLPEEFHRIIKLDVMETDLVIVIGSSLKVAPVSEILRAIPDQVPQIIINREFLPHLSRHFDVHLLGNSDTIIQELCRRLEWNPKHPSFSQANAAPASFQFHEPNIYAFEGGILSSGNWDNTRLDAFSSDVEGSDYGDQKCVPNFESSAGESSSSDEDAPNSSQPANTTLCNAGNDRSVPTPETFDDETAPLEDQALSELAKRRPRDSTVANDKPPASSPKRPRVD